MFTLEPLDHLKLIGNVVVGQLCRLVVWQRAGYSEPYVIPVYVCRECVIDECCFLIDLIDKLAGKRV